jgi:hypothetical protein
MRTGVFTTEVNFICRVALKKLLDLKVVFAFFEDVWIASADTSTRCLQNVSAF